MISDSRFFHLNKFCDIEQKPGSFTPLGFHLAGETGLEPATDGFGVRYYALCNHS